MYRDTVSYRDYTALDMGYSIQVYRTSIKLFFLSNNTIAQILAKDTTLKRE